MGVHGVWGVGCGVYAATDWTGVIIDGLQDFRTKTGSSSCHNLVLTGLFAPSSLHSGLGSRPTASWHMQVDNLTPSRPRLVPARPTCVTGASANRCVFQTQAGRQVVQDSGSGGSSLSRCVALGFTSLWLGFRCRIKGLGLTLLNDYGLQTSSP